MTKKDLLKKVAQLESANDHLLTELGYVDHLMRLVGFSGGLQTVKVTAQELYDTGVTNGDNECEDKDEDSF